MDNLEVPTTQQKLVVRKLTSNFKEAVDIETVEVPEPREGEILIKNKYVGINADDINVAKGRSYYAPENVPFGVGYEGIGTVVAVGKSVTGVKVGDAMSYIENNHCAFAEYACVPVKDAFPVPAVLPEYLVFVMSGLTAILVIEKRGMLKRGETVLVTAASGGLGHLVVQIAKNADCFVIGTCRSKEKEKFLKDLGCDHIINYKEENLSEVLSKHYPNGVDVVWETIGGYMFDLCLKHIAVAGRLLIIGGTSGYQTEDKNAFPKTEISDSREVILYKEASVLGGNVDFYKELFKDYYKKLLNSYRTSKLRPVYDVSNENNEILGMEGIIEAVEYLFKGEHCGKILAKIY